MQPVSQEMFVIDVLRELRDDRFSLPAWGRFFRRSWVLSWQTAHDNAALYSSWRRFTYLIVFLASLVVAANYLLMGLSDTVRLLPGFILCVVWQQCDLFWHLGLNRSVQGGVLLSRIGLANELTWLRGLGTSYLLGRLFGGVATPSIVALAIFLGGIVTDILDGFIARRTGTRSKLGQIADAETDVCLYLALTIILLQNGVLPLLFGFVMLLRFLVPLAVVLWRYLAFARLVHFGSTVWGKCAGLAQCLAFLVLLAPQPFSALAHVLSLPLLSIATGLLIIAPVAQMMRIRRGEG